METPGALRKPMQLQRRVALSALVLASATAVLSRTTDLASVFTFAGPAAASQSGVLAASSQKASLLTRRATEYYNNADRERLARQRREKRIEVRSRDWKAHKPILDMSKLPSVEDIYDRTYSGDADKDPIGGRKRYTMFVLFKNADEAAQGQRLKQVILEYMYFFKKEMSCRYIKAFPRKSPIDGNKVTALEYEMKEYGLLSRGQKSKNKYSTATLVEFQFMAPINAVSYIRAKMFGDSNILRFQVFCNTMAVQHTGEDNELLL
eukprot:TRINITY_DN106064_c0_g1_i1.p1 TRINITY_DN106064_c0_g1~~TRINITY_DN106064_c0_g1_i1.p1  ORF type:complete len:264 (-),score=52.99 TRINITY_DN106064_c0_g1_i1:55-846(-)